MPIDEVIKKYFEGLGLNVSSYESDPDSADKDGDGYMDFEDGTPYEANKNIIFILYLREDPAMVNEGRSLEKHYSGLGKYTISFGFNNYKTFMNYWSTIGDNYKKRGVSMITGLYYYNVTDVVLISHGVAAMIDGKWQQGALIKLGNEEYLVTEGKRKLTNSGYYSIMDIDVCRRFKSLDMMVCYSAYQGEGEFSKKNLADTFISHFRSIYEVYCFDCNSTLLIDNDKAIVIWAGVVDRALYPNVYDCPYKGQVLYYREKVGGQCYCINDLYQGNQYIYFKAKYQSDVRSVLNAAKNNYFDPVLR